MSPSPRIHKNDTFNIYFLTLTVVEWIDIFTKPEYFEILKNSLQYCIDNKGLVLYEYVFMTNHIHLIAGVNGGKSPLVQDRAIEPAVLLSENDIGLDSIIRDFKSYTTHKIKKIIEKDNRKYIQRLIKNSFKKNKNNEFQLWQDNNYPEQITSDEFRNIKINYIHRNPIKKGYILNPEDWLYSSAKQKILNLPENHPDVALRCNDWEI